MDVYDDNLDFELSGGAVESAEEAYQGNFVSKAGMYHVICGPGVEFGGVDDEGKPLPDKLLLVKLPLQVLRGQDDNGNELKDQADKFLTHRLYLESWETKPETDERGNVLAPGTKGPLKEDSAKKIRVFAYAFGVLSESDLPNPKVRIPFGKFEGKQAIVRVGEEEFNGRTQFKILWNNDAWPLTHEKVKDVLKLGTVAASQAAEGALAVDDLGDI